ncbi:hypothetical protein B0H17DRAFT_512115 [Mycena rosella]|uniref:F-box domain-containing protein n=1 Tax=Mycena rosella TaxID=1033263 RepID=A0AAD7BXU8_MYCRO|nr:hypothetical protein B0H17DRAFT_512115 [Mycena rosella]
MSFTESIALALFDWHCSTFRLPLIKQSMNVHGSLSLRARSLIDRLPNELLSAIFILAIEQGYHDKSDPVTTSPTTISHICRRWRQVALATGALWAKIVLTFPTSDHQLARTLTWLSRSKTYALDILLDFRDPLWDWEEETHGFRWVDMEAVLRMLIPSAARWRNVELLTDTWAPIFAFLARTRTVGPSLARLETLHLARCNAYFAAKGEVFQPTELSQHLPLFGGPSADLLRLRELTLTGVHIDWAATPLADLTKLELKYQAADVMPTVAQLAHLLSSCHSLESLAIVGSGPQFPAPGGILGGGATLGAANGGSTEHGTIRLTRVTAFTFGFVDVNCAVQLLSLLDLPTLNELSLEDVSASLRHEAPDDASALLDWLSTAANAHDISNASPSTNATSVAVPSTSAASFPLAQLHTLSLLAIHAPLSAFTRLFGSCAGLSVLRLHGVAPSALAALEDPMRLPHLHTLTADADAVLFARVVETRGSQLADARFEARVPAYEDDDDDDRDGL